MPCCFGGSAKGPKKPDAPASPGGHAAVADASPVEAAALAAAEEEKRKEAEEEEEAARKREEERRREEEAERELEMQRRRSEETARELERKQEAMSAKRSAEAKARCGTKNVVVRKELRQMSHKEQKRFCDALHKLMQNQDSSPSTSQFFRIAGHRGWPSGHCQRGEETFPGWHRGYLAELERALVEADQALGNDGDVGLPYWDWLNVHGEEVVPKCIRDSFATLPLGLVDPEQAGNLGALGFAQLASDVEIRAYLAKAKIHSMVTSCLSDSAHWMHASRRCRRRGHSLEAVHDQVCMACGFPVSDAAYGGFHPCYLLLLCNLDRIYERYLQLESPEECKQDFRLRQEALHENRGEPNRFERALEPFRHPRKKRALLPADTFSTIELGYIYEELPQMPQMWKPREAKEVEDDSDEDNAPAECSLDDNIGNEVRQPVFAAFRGLSQSVLGDRSYALHVFMLHRDDVPHWSPPMPIAKPSSWEAPRAAHLGWEDIQEYAGCGAVLGCAGGGSSSSSATATGGGSRQPFDVIVEVTDTLRNLRLSRHDAELLVLCVDQTGRVMKLEDTPLPPPALIGPLFEDPDIELREKCRGGEVFTLQRRLGMLGYDPGPCDGVFGPKVKEAVKRFQEFNHLPADGVAGSLTKELLSVQRKDLSPDLGMPPWPKRFIDGETVYYQVATLPRHLDRVRDATLEEIAHAFAQWGKATNITFAPAEDGGLPPLLTLRFEDLSESNALHHDGLAMQGGLLSESAKDGITFDASEHWLLRGQDAPPRRSKAVWLYPVLLHGIGHCLGLPNSSDRDSVMWPYYSTERLEPVVSERDASMARSMVKNTKPCGCDFKEPNKGCVLQ